VVVTANGMGEISLGLPVTHQHQLQHLSVCGWRTKNQIEKKKKKKKHVSNAPAGAQRLGQRHTALAPNDTREWK
jgi:hypothetical protein